MSQGGILEKGKKLMTINCVRCTKVIWIPTAAVAFLETRRGAWHFVRRYLGKQSSVFFTGLPLWKVAHYAECRTAPECIQEHMQWRGSPLPGKYWGDWDATRVFSPCEFPFHRNQYGGIYGSLATLPGGSGPFEWRRKEICWETWNIFFCRCRHGFLIWFRLRIQELWLRAK